MLQPLVFLDTRPVQISNRCLVDTVLEALESLPDDGVLKLIARSQPDILITRLTKRGHKTYARQQQEDIWDIEVLGAGAPDIVDLRGLEAPEPMQRILLAVAGLDTDKTYLARLPHVPHPLFPLLKERGLSWWVHEEMDHSALLAVRATP